MGNVLKVLGVVLVIALAFGTTGSSAASAAEFHSTAAGSTNVMAGGGEWRHTFTSTAGELTCNGTSFSGTQTASTAASLELAPFYIGCHLIVFGSTISVTVAENGCRYKFYSSGAVDIICPAGKSIVISGAGCTIAIGAQTGLKTVSYTNAGTGIIASMKLTGIKYSHSGFTCGSGSGLNGTYAGSTQTTGTATNGSAVTISFS